MRVLITGSRTWDNIDTIRDALRNVLSQDGDITVVHGGARGADEIAGHVARELGMKVEVHPADWETHGRQAGLLRNAEMVDLGADLVLSFRKNYSRGTTHCINLARGKGIQIISHEEVDLT